MNEEIDNETVFVSSSGNVFEDLGLPNADEMLAKAEISLAIRRRIEELKLTQTAAAAILETDQAKVSEIVNGRLREYTLDRLLRYAKLLGIDVKISLKTTRKRPGKMLVGTIK